MQKKPAAPSADGGPGDPGRTPVSRGVLEGLIGYHLRRTQLAVFEDFARAAGADGVTPGQFGALQLISANPGMSQTDVGQALSIERSTVVGVIDKLERRGLVRRTPSEVDRRSNELSLTEDGRTLVDDLTARIRVHEARIARDLSDEERATLIDLLRRVRAAAVAAPDPEV